MSLKTPLSYIREFTTCSLRSHLQLRDSIFWYAKAAGNGDLQAAYYLAEAYETGEGVPKDLKMAFDLYKGVAGEALLFEWISILKGAE